MKRRFNVVIATDGSPAAKAAVATAVQFPWPNGTHAFAVWAAFWIAVYLGLVLAPLAQRSRDRSAGVGARAHRGVGHCVAAPWKRALWTGIGLSWLGVIAYNARREAVVDAAPAL